MLFQQIIMALLFFPFQEILLCPPQKKRGYITLHILVGWSVRRQNLSDQQLENSQPKDLLTCMVVGHDQQMTLIDFGVFRSKVKVTMTFKLRGHTCFTSISCFSINIICLDLYKLVFLGFHFDGIFVCVLMLKIKVPKFYNQC